MSECDLAISSVAYVTMLLGRMEGRKSFVHISRKFLLGVCKMQPLFQQMNLVGRAK